MASSRVRIGRDRRKTLADGVMGEIRPVGVDETRPGRYIEVVRRGTDPESNSYFHNFRSGKMAEDRPSWREIDKMRDRPGGKRKRKRKDKNKHEIQEHATRYDRYKADLDRMFDQGMAGELLKKKSTQGNGTQTGKKTKTNTRSKASQDTPNKRSGKPGRIPKDNRASSSRLKLIRTVIDAGDHTTLCEALDELKNQFGLPDDWNVLIRALEHDDEDMVVTAVRKMQKLLPLSAKIPRRFTLRERLRTVGQTAGDDELRKEAAQLEESL